MFAGVTRTGDGGYGTLGALLGLALLVGVPLFAWNASEAEASGWAMLLVPVVLYAAAWLLGMVFLLTVGMAAPAVLWGGLIAAVVAAYAGAWSHLPAWILTALAGASIGSGQRARLEGLLDS